VLLIQICLEKITQIINKCNYRCIYCVFLRNTRLYLYFILVAFGKLINCIKLELGIFSARVVVFCVYEVHGACSSWWACEGAAEFCTDHTQNFWVDQFGITPSGAKHHIRCRINIEPQSWQICQKTGKRLYPWAHLTFIFTYLVFVIFKKPRSTSNV